MNTLNQQELRTVLNDELCHVHTSDRQRQALCVLAKGEKRVKTKISFALALTAVIVLTACAVLAASGAFDALIAVWNDSFGRMHTTAQVDIVDESDVSAYLEQFEASYGGPKEDLIISTVPGDDGLPMEEAIRIARAAVMEKFGTPASELDAMGVYPTYYETPYQNEISEWQVYITPRTDVNLDEDHDCPAPGEYCVDVQSPSGEVTACFFYNDDFWPDYALRCWESGSRDYVYEQAQRPDFLLQSREDQQRFIDMLTEAGYDPAPLQQTRSSEARLRAMRTLLCFADPADDLFASDDACFLTALREMESRYGLTREVMEKYSFIAVRSPQPSETVDICFCYNFNKEAEGAAGPCETLGVGYAYKLGYFMICLDAKTGTAVDAVRIPWDEYLVEADTEGLLSRDLWSGNDLAEYDRMMDELRALDAGYVPGRDSLNALLNQADLVIRRYGGDPSVYTAARPDDSGEYTMVRFLYEHGLTEDAIIAAGRSDLLARGCCTEAELDRASYIVGTMFDDMEQADPEKVHPTLLVLLETGDGSGTRWYCHFDLNLHITQLEESQGDLHG